MDISVEMNIFDIRCVVVHSLTDRGSYRRYEEKLGIESPETLWRYGSVGWKGR